MRCSYLVFVLNLFFIVGMISCNGDLEDIIYSPEEYKIAEEIYANLGPFPIDPSNPLTVEGIKLGQFLFFDPILSKGNEMSCSSCHHPDKAFTDGVAQSTGVDGLLTPRSSMSLINTAYYTKGLFWDGRVQTLEEQALLPVEDVIELHETWPNVVEKLKADPSYPRMFREAFGIEDTEGITKELAAKALSQFQLIILSGNSKFDRWNLNTGQTFSDEELVGYDTFFDVNPLIQDGECGHCHNNPLFTTNQYFDNGIQEAMSIADYADPGKGGITSINTDFGKMRAPTLRNIELTAPYMHDGRFETLEEVVDHYSSGGHSSINQDILVYPLNLSDDQKVGLVAFLKTLTDTTYLSNEYLKNPFE